MQVMIKNFRGIGPEVSFPASDRITLIAGRNSNGKSSVTLAVGAALTGQISPYLKSSSTPNKISHALTSTSLGMLLPGGAKRGGVRLTQGDDTITVGWPKGEVSSTGRPPQASLYASGLINIFDLSAKDRASEIARVLKSEVTRKNLESSLREAGYQWDEKAENNVIDRIWIGIDENGWDGANEKLRKNGTKMKGQWEDVTSERYGSAKGDGWIPEGWDDDLLDASLDGLEADIIIARDNSDKAIYQKGASEEVIAQMRERAGQDPVDLGPLDEAINMEKSYLEQAEKARSALLPATEGIGVPCPCCGELIKIITSRPGEMKLEAAGERLSDEVLQKRRTAIASGDGKVANAKTALNKAEQAKRDVERDNDRIGDAVDELKRYENRDADAADKEINAANENLRIAIEFRDMFAAYSKAGRLHASIVQNKILIDVTDASGVRKTKLQEVLTAFNDSHLAPLCDAAGWERMTINEDLEPEYNGTPLFLASGSESWRARILIQIVLGKIEQSDLVVIDGADILDGPNRNDLFKMLKIAEIPIMIAATMAKRESVPDLAKAGLGLSYWIDGGRISAIAEMQEDAQ